MTTSDDSQVPMGCVVPCKPAHVSGISECVVFLGANMSPESTEMFGSSIMLVKQSQITHIGSFMALILPPMLKLEMPFYCFTNYQCNIE
jgi:hypothetical protein